MNYNERNRHKRDASIQFDCDQHQYIHNGHIFKSVTTIVDECFKQFDADYWARRKAPSLGMTPQQVKDMWNRKGEISRNLGTQMHTKIEHYYLGTPHHLDDQDGTDRLFALFTKNHTLHPYRTEWAIFDEESRVAGTLDFLDYQNGKFSIYDWKRSNKVVDRNGTPEKANRWGDHAYAPIAHIVDTTFWHYALQVSIYRYILEKNYGIQVSDNHLAVFHPDYDRPHVVDTPYLKDEVISVLNKRKSEF